jgi:hypothetical protein
LSPLLFQFFLSSFRFGFLQWWQGSLDPNHLLHLASGCCLLLQRGMQV